MASVLHLFLAPKRRLPMEELAEITAVEDSGFDGCAHARPGEQRQVLLVDNETLELMETPAGRHSRKHYHHWLERERACARAAASCGRFAPGGHRGVYPVRFDGENSPGAAAGVTRPTRNVVQSGRRRRDPPGRRHRKAYRLGFVSGRRRRVGASGADSLSKPRFRRRKAEG